MTNVVIDVTAQPTAEVGAVRRAIGSVGVVAGASGDVFLRGIPGPTGPQGQQGQQGERGAQGETGQTGEPGKDGARGPQGASAPKPSPEELTEIVRKLLLEALNRG